MRKKPTQTCNPLKQSDSAKDQKVSEMEADPEFLKTLRECEFQAIDEFDKTVLMLSGGAIGVTFVLLKDVVSGEGFRAGEWLASAWISWGFSLACVLCAFYFSHLANRRAQREYQSGKYDAENLGGFCNKCILVLNPVSAILFLLGLIFITTFVTRNLSKQNAQSHSSSSTIVQSSIAKTNNPASPYQSASTGSTAGTGIASISAEQVKSSNAASTSSSATTNKEVAQP